MKKKIFISFLRSPVGGTFHLEGLRIAGGALAGDDDHELTIAYIGRGARCALKGVDMAYAKSMIDLFEKDSAGKRFYVERESLDEEGLSESELDENFGIKSRDELRKKFLEADVTFSF